MKTEKIASKERPPAVVASVSAVSMPQLRPAHRVFALSLGASVACAFRAPLALRVTPLGAASPSPALMTLTRLRGGGRALGSLTGVAQRPRATPSMLSGLGISAAVIGGFNALGCAITLVSPERGEKLTDLLGTGSIALSALAVHAASPAGMAARPLLVTACIVTWGARLASFLFYRVLSVGSDTRLTAYFETPGGVAAFWSVSAVWGWMNALPHSLLCFSPAAATPLGACGYAAAALFGVGFGVEAVADWQKWQFKGDPANKGRWCDVGLWSQCRHPNYAGEIVVWTSVFLLCAPALVGAPGVGSVFAQYARVLAAASTPAFVTGLLLGVSGVPLAEARNEERFGSLEAYKAYKRDTPLLVPRISVGAGGSRGVGGPQ